MNKYSVGLDACVMSACIGQGVLFIRREELALLGEGTVCLGEPVAKYENTIIRFSVL